MAGEIDFKKIYFVQDTVLITLNQLDNGFYLTGGTCLHRFIDPRRFSDDLVFFCNDNNLFRDYRRESIEALSNLGKKIEVVTDTRDFVRVRIDDLLKIDFVNDYVFRFGRTGFIHPAP